MRRFLLKALLLVALVVAVLRAVGAAAPRHALLAWKAGGLRAHADRVTTVFLGSSRTHRHLHPGVYDRVMAAHGRATHAVNLARPGASLDEIGYNLDWLLRQDLPRLQTVVIEVMPAGPPDSLNRATRRAAAAQDAARVEQALRALATGDGPWRARWDEAATRLRLGLRRALHLGDGAALLERAARQRRLLPAAYAAGSWAASVRGYVPLERETRAAFRARRDAFAGAAGDSVFAARLRAVRRDARQASAAPATAAPVVQRTAAQLLGMARRARAQGLHVLFFAPPNVGQNPLVVARLRAAPDAPPVLDFGRPAVHPAFYVKARWYDVGHLRAPAARALTAQAAAEAARVLDAEAAEAGPRAAGR